MLSKDISRDEASDNRHSQIRTTSRGIKTLDGVTNADNSYEDTQDDAEGKAKALFIIE